MSEMLLEHRTQKMGRLLSILREGIRPSTETRKVGLAAEPVDVVCFTAINDFQLRHDNPLGRHWGHYPIILDPEYVKQNVDQFRDVNGKAHYKDFKQFVEDLGIKSLIWGSPVRRVPNQIISLKPIPVEGIEKVIVPFYLFRQHERELLDAKPQHVELYTMPRNYGEYGITKVEVDNS